MDEQPKEIMQPVLEKKTPVALFIIISILISGLAFGAAGYFISGYFNTAETAPLLEKNKNLEVEKVDLKKQLDEAQQSLTAATDELGKLQNPELRKILGTGVTSDDQKIVTEKVLNYYVDYYSDELGLADPVRTVIIESDVTKDGTIYHLTFIHKGEKGFTKVVLKPEDKVYTEWYPGCKYSDCRDIPQKFAEKYPKIIEMSKKDLASGAGLKANGDLVVPAASTSTMPTKQ